MQKEKNYYSIYNLLAVIIIISIYKLIVLNHLLSEIDLYLDEAYYWGWAQSFEFGYYSKPPMIAWVISLFTSICGDSEICIKAPALLFYPLTSIIIYLISKELFDEKIAFLSSIAFFTLPIVSISSMIISTDVVLLFFLSLTILFFIKAIKYKNNRYFLIAGLFGGFGLLSKYNMILIVFGLFLYLIFSKENRDILKNRYFYFALILAALVYMPNLIWNYQNDFVSFSHTKEISKVDKELFHFDSLFSFIASQFLVIGPIFFATFLYLLFKPKFSDDKFKMLYFFSIVFIFVITMQSFLSRAFANWAFPTYVVGIILITYYLIINKKIKLFFIAIFINITFMFAIYHFSQIINFLNIDLKAKNDPYKRVKGWESSAKEIQIIINNYPNRKLLFKNRKLMSEFIYYLKPHPFDSVIWNPKDRMQNHYDLTTSLRDKKGEDFILITKDKKLNKEIISSFSEYKKIGEVREKLYKDFSREYTLFYLKNFLGYAK